MNEHPLNQYKHNIDAFGQEADSYRKKYNFWSVLRASFFLAGLVALIYYASEREASIFFILLGVGAVVFAFMVRKHQQISFQRKYFENLVKVNEDECKRLDGRLRELENTGEEYIDKKHAYSIDLDIFGSSSLFQLISRTVTAPGHKKLADWLLGKATSSEIKARQEAVLELKNKLQFRQEFQANGMFTSPGFAELKLLTDWIGKPSRIINKSFLVAAGYILPLVMLVALIAYFSFDLPNIVIAVPVLANLLVLGMVAKPITILIIETGKSANILKTLERLITLIEDQEFLSPKLQAIQQKLADGNVKASVSIKQLSKILNFLEARQNVFFYGSANLFFLAEVIGAIRLEKWEQKHREDLVGWLDALAEFDSLNSFGAMAYSFPDYSFPSISETPYVFNAKELGHPLIGGEERVTNDFGLSGHGKTIIITGSNMSGKSTFLRTLGINAVLAFSGAPVCAKSLELSLFQVFTSMRITDSLEEHTSAFYAELKRIKLLLDEINGNEEVFYLLDEVLKGTNSKDRHNGVRAVISQLVKKPCFGLLSTHDLELSQLSEEYPEQISNFSFNSSIQDSKLHFDHKLTPGLCHSFSASKLMEGLGIILGETNEEKK